MTREETYFTNHGVGNKWPFSIYHHPIEASFLSSFNELNNPQNALNVGCGLFHSYEKYKKKNCQWFAADIDPRCIEFIKKNQAEIITKSCDFLPRFDGILFDFIMASEVIEHITESRAWIFGLYSLLKPGGKLVLSTPNYGWSLLPLIEYTFLQLIAMSKGFSRLGIHPNKYTKAKLHRDIKASITSNDLDFSIKKVSAGMVLVAELKKLRTS